MSEVNVKSPQWTSGDWYVRGVSFSSQWAISSDASEIDIARVNGKSNAHLLAAAPEMYEALVKLSNEVMGSLPMMEALARREFGNTNYNILIQRAEEARAIIAKAEAR